MSDTSSIDLRTTSRRYHHHRNDARVSAFSLASILCFRHLDNVTMGFPLGILEQLTPWPIPFVRAPWIPQQTKSFSIHFNSSHDGVRVALHDPLSFSTAPEETRSTTKKKVLVNFRQLLPPKVLLIEDISTGNFGRNASCEVLKSFACKPSFNRSVVLC
jgi:hypothetical protein